MYRKAVKEALAGWGRRIGQGGLFWDAAFMEVKGWGGRGEGRRCPSAAERPLNPRQILGTKPEDDGVWGWAGCTPHASQPVATSVEDAFLSAIVILGLCPEDLPACLRPQRAWRPEYSDCQKSQALPPVGINSLRFALMLVSDEAPEATCLSKYVAPSGAPFGDFCPAACVSLARRRRASGPKSDVRPGAGPAAASPDGDASAWPVAREVPAGWCTIPTGPSPGGCWSGHC